MNTSLESGTFPSSEKHAIVKLLINGTNDKDKYSSYRVFHASIVSEVIKKVILKQLQDHLQNFDTIPKFRSAYRKLHSVETAIVESQLQISLPATEFDNLEIDIELHSRIIKSVQSVAMNYS